VSFCKEWLLRIRTLNSASHVWTRFELKLHLRCRLGPWNTSENSRSWFAHDDLACVGRATPATIVADVMWPFRAARAISRWWRAMPIWLRYLNRNLPGT